MRRAALAAVAATVALASSTTAWGQRGGDYVEQDVSPVKHTNSGFPGMFDTELVQKGAFTGSLPWLNGHFGVTDNFTVGSNLAFLAPLVALSPSGVLFTRYRVNSTDSTETTMDVNLGGTKLDTDELEVRSTVGMFGSNTMFVLNDSNHLIINVLGGTFGFGFVDKDTDTYTDAALYGILAGITYRGSIARWVSFQATLLPLSYLNGRMDSSSALFEIDLSRPAAFETMVYRGNFSFRAGSWLFELGAFGIGKIPVPWLNVGFQVGGR